MLGLGVSSAQASSSVSEAIQVAAPLLAGSGGGANNADVANYDSGAQLAGLVHAYRSGANTTLVGNRIDSLSTDILGTGGAGPTFGGDQAYGLVVAGQLNRAGTSGNLAAVATFYTTGYQDSGPFANFQAYADYVGSASGDPTAPNADGTENGVVWDLGFHVLATHTLGSAFNSQNAAFSSTLIQELGYFDTTVGDINAGEFSATEVLAVALWGLKSSGYDNSTTTASGGGNWGNKDLITLAGVLRDKIDGDITAGQVFTEDLSYGILALEQFVGDSVGAGGVLTQADITAYQLLLADGVNHSPLSPTGAVPIYIRPDGVYTGGPGGTGVGAAYAGAALQALPEPASLSFLGLAGMGLLARRRRA
ncbi:hypothetical protein BH10PLA1_BH10PLA1_08280 [soil metagenome]